MRRLLALLLPLALVAATAPLAPAALAQHDPGEATSEVTLRVAPEGFVVPSHWAAGNDAVWLVDPTEETTFNDRDGIAGCELTVPAGGDGVVDGADVLDHATDEGCISGWDAETGSLGRFVTSVDGRDQVAPGGVPVLWWLIQVDGRSASTGIDGLALDDGQDLSFVYYAGA